MDTRRLKRLARQARQEIFRVLKNPDSDDFSLFSLPLTLDSLHQENQETETDLESAALALFTDFIFDRMNRLRSRSLFSSLTDDDFRGRLFQSLEKLVQNLTLPEDWDAMESCGWLYQFFIAARKQTQRQGVVNASDLAASTQLFTPKWIADYLVENTLGSRLLEIFPESPTLARLSFRTPDPNDSDPLSQASLSETALSEISDARRLKIIREIKRVTFLDPACGTGHILLSAYALLEKVYRELGISEEKIPEIILTKNLFGLDLDESAVKIARRILLSFIPPVSLGKRSKTTEINILHFPTLSSAKRKRFGELFAEETGTEWESFLEFLRYYREKSFAGSLIRLPQTFWPMEKGDRRGIVRRILRKKIKTFDGRRPSKRSLPQEDDLVLITKIDEGAALWDLLTRRYDCVVTNPPYLGVKGISDAIKNYARSEGFLGLGNLYSLFIEQAAYLTKKKGHVGIIAMQGWMFLPTFKEFRRFLLREKTLITMAHLGVGGFAEISGEVVATSAFCFRNEPPASDHRPVFYRLVEGNAEEKEAGFFRPENRRQERTQSDFLASSESPLYYWGGEKIDRLLREEKTLGEFVDLRQGLATGDNRRFLRYWFEVDPDSICWDAANRQTAKESGKKWFPYNKGGGTKKWFGESETVINWENDGEELRENRPRSVIRNPNYYFREGISWSLVGTGSLGARYLPPGFLFDVGGSSLFLRQETLASATPSEAKNILGRILGFLGSSVAVELMKFINPTVNYQIGDLARLPFNPSRFDSWNEEIETIVRELVALTQKDSQEQELSRHFCVSSLLNLEIRGKNLAETTAHYFAKSEEISERVRNLQERLNRIFIEAYGLTGEISPAAALEDAALSANPIYRFSRLEKDTRRRLETVRDFLSYFIGVLTGRFPFPGEFQTKSLSPQWQTIREDGFFILTSDFLTNLLTEFLTALWPSESLEENLLFLADSLCLLKTRPVCLKEEKSEKEESLTKAKTILNDYFRTSFFEDHQKRYHHCPIYLRLSDIFSFPARRGEFPEVLLYYPKINLSLFQKITNHLEKMADESSDKIQERIAFLRQKVNKLSESEVIVNRDAGIEANLCRIKALFED